MPAPLRELADSWRKRLLDIDLQRRKDLALLWLQMERELDPALAAYVYAPEEEREERGRVLVAQTQEKLDRLLVIWAAMIIAAGVTYYRLGTEAGREFLDAQDIPPKQAPGSPQWGEEQNKALDKVKSLALAGLLVAMRGADGTISAISAIRNGISKGLGQLITVSRDYPVSQFRDAIGRYATPGKWVRLSARAPTTCMGCIMEDGTILDDPSDFSDHPHGLCFVVPIEGESWLGETGEEWFLSLGGKKQEQMMGRDYYAAWKAGGYDLSELSKKSSAGYVIVRPLKELGGVRP